MNIGIIAAMDKELSLLLPLLENSRETVIDDITFYLGDCGNHSIILMKSGIGKVNAALAAMELIKQFAPDIVINTGVAGGTGSEAGILDTVVGTTITYHDVWCGPGTVDGQAAGCPRFFESDRRVVSLQALRPGANLHHGLIASGDIFVSRPDDLERIKKLYPDVMAVDMESAAIAHTCHLKNTPFFCIRVVSDTPGKENNEAQYDNFWEAAPRQTFEIISKLISELPESFETEEINEAGE